MDKSFDLLIGKLIKSWTGQHHPPADARAHLLWDAVHQAQRPASQLLLQLRPQFNNSSVQTTNEWSQTLFLWVNEHSIQAGMPARLT